MAKSLDKPIHFVPDGKNFTDLEKAKKSFGVTEVTNEKELIKYLEKGNHVYCYIDPQDSELSSGEEKQCVNLIWNKDRETAIDNYYNSAEGI